MNEEVYKKTINLVLDSLFLAERLTYLAWANPSNDKFIRIGYKAWQRHWRRTKLAISLGIPLKIPDDAII